MLKMERLRRLEREKLRYFCPHGGQKDLLEMFSRDGVLIVGTGAGNGWGKTIIPAAIAAALAFPDLAAANIHGAFDHSIFKEWKFPKRGRFYSTPSELGEIGTLQASIKDYFPHGKYASRKRGKAYDSEFITDSGWVFDLFSYEQDEEQAAGPNIGFQWFNEPPPEALWKEALARARAGGIIGFGATSLDVNPWFVEGVLNKHDGKTILVRYGHVCENCKEHGENGNLEHEQIERILSQYDPDEREARETGKPLSLSGAIYRGFNHNVHVAKDPLTPPEGATLYQVVDPAIGKPVYSLWAYADHSGLYIYDEWPDFPFQGAKDLGYTVDNYVQLFKEREGGRHIHYRILDRHYGNQRRSMGGKTLKQEFSEAGLDFDDSYSISEPKVEVETGVLKGKEFLAYDKTKPVDSLNKPRVLISPTCTNLIKSFKLWGRNPKTGVPREEYKDPMDCYRYLVMAEPGPQVHRDWSDVGAAQYGVKNG